MIAAKIDDFGIPLLDLLQDKANEARVFVSPASLACEAPPVDDVAVENKLFAVGVLEEMVYLLNLAVERAEVHVGNEYRLIT